MQVTLVPTQEQISNRNLHEERGSELVALRESQYSDEIEQQAAKERETEDLHNELAACRNKWTILTAKAGGLGITGADVAIATSPSAVRKKRTTKAGGAGITADVATAKKGAKAGRLGTSVDVATATSPSVAWGKKRSSDKNKKFVEPNKKRSKQPQSSNGRNISTGTRTNLPQDRWNPKPDARFPNQTQVGNWVAALKKKGKKRTQTKRRPRTNLL